MFLENAIEFINVSFSRGSRVVLDDISFKIPLGKVSAIMGPSGCGKTTILNLISGQLQPDSGQIKVLDQDITNFNRAQLYELRKSMGLLFQSGALFTDLDIFENVAFPLREHTNMSEEMIRIMVLLKLQAVGLRGAHNLYPNELSGGMLRRAALARATVLDPEVMMYDEPFAGQDPISMGVLVKLIKLLNDALDMTTVFVSHNVPETMDIAENLILLANGKIMGLGDPKMLLSSNNDWIKQFMQGLPDGPVPFHYPAEKYIDDLMRKAW